MASESAVAGAGGEVKDSALFRDVPGSPPNLTDCLTPLESAWVVQQARKAARTLHGSSKFVPHQGKRERLRRLRRIYQACRAGTKVSP